MLAFARCRLPRGRKDNAQNCSSVTTNCMSRHGEQVRYHIGTINQSTRHGKDNKAVYPPRGQCRPANPLTYVTAKVSDSSDGPHYTGCLLIETKVGWTLVSRYTSIEFFIQKQLHFPITIRWNRAVIRYSYIFYN